jgi:release factor glutamine methyltransferase
MVEDSSHVYQPAEDTYLLLRAALKEARPEDCSIEIGCGRAKIASALAPSVKSIIATDINPYAVKMARAHGIEAIRTDLFRGIDAKFDLVLFNPPYLPTSEEEKLEGWLNHAFDGGESGRETICCFLEELRAHLNEGGRLAKRDSILAN